MKKRFAVAILLLSVLMVPLGISGLAAERVETISGVYQPVDRERAEMSHAVYQPVETEKVEESTATYPVYEIARDEYAEMSPSVAASSEGTITVNTNRIEDATFTISGPATYSGSGTFWRQSNAPPGTYTITYGSVSGYKSPPSETKTLSDGGSITFCGSYLLKKMAGDNIDFGDGYILVIREVNPEVGEVLMELQLDDHTIDEKIVRKDEYYKLAKYNQIEPIIRVIDIDHETTGDYVFLVFPDIEIPIMLVPHLNLIISSLPQGADIYLDGKYVGKTTRKIPVIPDFKMHLLRLVLSGYEEEEQTFKFEQGEGKKEIQMTLSKIEPTPTSRPTLTPLTPTPSTPAPTPVSHAYSPSPTPPGFLAISFIFAILCAYWILKRKHS